MQGAEPRGGRSVDEQLRSFDDVPLFMRDLPAAEGNTALEALQSLAYEGGADSSAETFKEQGNEYFAAKRFREALGFYKQGLDANPEDAAVREALLLNSAAANIALQNYGSALHNARDAMLVNRRSLKALFRAATAFLALDRTRDAEESCALALEFAPDAPEFVALRDKAQRRAAELARRDAARKQRAERQQAAKQALHVALLARGLWLADTPADVADIPHVPHFDPAEASDIDAPAWRAPDPVRTPLILPVLFLYPQHRETDLVAAFHEDTTLGDQLAAMFPAPRSAPWDAAGEYVAGRLSVIAVTHRRRLLRIAARLTLREALDSAAAGVGAERDGIEMRGGAVRLYVFPRGSPAERAWIDETKAGAADP